MATSLGELLGGVGEHVTRLGSTVEYVAIASSVSLVVGGVILPKLLNRGSQPPPPPACPPCACFCACGPLPPAPH
jgi:hypothetical protein